MIPPLTKWINDIKVKLGFSRTMTAAGADVVDAVNKQSDQIAALGEIIYTEADNIDYSSATGEQILGSITVTPGVWLIFGSISINEGGTKTLYPTFKNIPYAFFNQSSAVSAGGYITSIGYVNTNTNRTIQLAEYIYDQSSKYRYRLGAVRLQ